MIGGLGRPRWGGAPTAIGGTTGDNGSKINRIMDGGGRLRGQHRARGGFPAPRPKVVDDTGLEPVTPGM
jgi:hypothetical protein